MRTFLIPILFAALLPAVLWPSVAGAQSSRAAAAGLSSVQTERNAVDLKQGMSVEEVQRLLGKPRRTALKSNGSPTAASQGTLLWTYQWPSGSSPAILHVEFAPKAAEGWFVNSWEWANY
jgi:hypothetical protein